MRTFWSGVFTGVVVTLLLGGILGFAITQRAHANMPGGNFGPSFFIRTILEHHGEFGTIDAIDDQSLTLVERNGVRQVLAVSSDTEIYRGKTKIGLAELNKGQRVIVISAEQPDGTLKARLIRIMGSSMLLQQFNSSGI